MKTPKRHPAWGWAVVYGHKPVQCRAWPVKYRGRLAIHAGRGNPAEDEWAWGELARLGVKVPDDVPRRAIAGTVEMVDCVRKEHRLSIPCRPEIGAGSTIACPPPGANTPG